ncbi:MAG: hypothetical protein WC430_03925 [Patescibacteria group bacterium]
MEHSGEQFLHQKDSKLHVTQPVEYEQTRKKRLGEETTQKPAEKIADWLAVIEKTHTGHREDPRVLERIKEYYHKQNVIKPEGIPEAYFDNQKRLAREQGHGDIEITPEMRNQLTEVIITDQKSSLDKWVDYLSSPDSNSFPMWTKYWAFNGILKLSTYDKEKHSFGKRKKDTVAPFADLNREALAYIVDKINKKANQEDIAEQMDNPEFKKLLDGANFGKLYAWAIEEVTPAQESELADTKGEWVKYSQNSDHMPLVGSLQGHGTGWCTAGESTAQTQLKGGDFYVYYSLNNNGKPTVPRAAIRMSGDSIGEVRGVGPDQNLDPYIAPVVQKKLAEFPDGNAYEKKTEDMKKLTELERKTAKEEKLTKEDLIFLYEVDNKIEGFGFQTDPRIKELRDKKNPKEDAPLLLDYEPRQIAWNKNEINKNTKAYIGPLFPNIFQKLKHLEHIYTSFPEGRIVKSQIEIGGKTKDELEREMKEKNIQVYGYATSMMKNKDFTTAKKPEPMDLIRLKVGSLGINKTNPTTDDIYAKAKELGLELCPAETGPQYCLQYDNQPTDEYLFIGMKQITASNGSPKVFRLGRDDSGLWLCDGWAKPASEWDPDIELVFRVRK